MGQPTQRPRGRSGYRGRPQGDTRTLFDKFLEASKEKGTLLSFVFFNPPLDGASELNQYIREATCLKAKVIEVDRYFLFLEIYGMCLWVSKGNVLTVSADISPVEL